MRVARLVPLGLCDLNVDRREDREHVGLHEGHDELNRVDEVFIAKHGSRAWKTRSKLTGTYDKSRQAGIITH